MAESIKQRWIQIEEIEHNLTNLIKFLDKYIESEDLVVGKAMIKQFRWNCNKTILWEDAIDKYNFKRCV